MRTVPAATKLGKYNSHHKPAGAPGGTGGQFTDADGARGGSDRPILAADRSGQAKPAMAPNDDDVKQQPWVTRSNKDFRNFIAGEEHSTTSRPQTDGYDEDNGNALGRYQLQKSSSLKDIGWVDDDGNWTAKAAAHGVTSDEEFLNNREAQETALDLVLSRAESQARSKYITIKGDNGTPERVSLCDLAQRGQTYNDSLGRTIKITPAGVTAAVHREGAGKTHDFLARVARNGWTTRGLRHYSKDDRAVAQRLLDAQNVPYTPYHP